MDNELIKKAKEDGILNQNGTFIHKVDQQKINCPHLIKSDNIKNPLNCPIYNAMKEKYQSSSEIRAF